MRRQDLPQWKRNRFPVRYDGSGRIADRYGSCGEYLITDTYTNEVVWTGFDTTEQASVLEALQIAEIKGNLEAYSHLQDYQKYAHLFA